MTHKWNFLYKPWEMDKPLPCPNCAKQPRLGGFYHSVNPNKYGHRYGRFCSLRCGVSFANKYLVK